MAGEIVVALTVDVVKKILELGMYGSIASPVHSGTGKHLDMKICQAVSRFVRVRRFACHVTLDEPGDAALLRNWCLATAQELEYHPCGPLQAHARPLREAADDIEEALRSRRGP
jgi:hypothetical protein